MINGIFNRQKKLFILILYLFILVLRGYEAYKHPAYNGDILAYTSVIYSFSNIDPVFVHDTTYATLKRELPPEKYLEITAASPSRKFIHDNPKTFLDKAPKFIVKPLYIAMIYLFYKSGIYLTIATVMPSTIAYILCGLLFFYWSGKYLSPWLGFGVSTLLMNLPPFIQSLKLSTPDFLSTFFVFTAFYFIIEKPKFIWTYIFLLLAIFTRIDNLLPAFCILTMLFFNKQSNIQLPTQKYCFSVCGLVVTFFIITSLTLKYNGDIFFLRFFYKDLVITGDANKTVFFSNYTKLIFIALAHAVISSYIIWFTALALVVLRKVKKEAWQTEHYLLITILIIIFIRFFLDPYTIDRFYLPYYFIFSLVFIKSFQPSILKWLNTMQ